MQKNMIILPLGSYSYLWPSFISCTQQDASPQPEKQPQFNIPSSNAPPASYYNPAANMYNAASVSQTNIYNSTQTNMYNPGSASQTSSMYQPPPMSSTHVSAPPVMNNPQVSPAHGSQPSSYYNPASNYNSPPQPSPTMPPQVFNPAENMGYGSNLQLDIINHNLHDDASNRNNTRCVNYLIVMLYYYKRNEK